MWHCKTALVHNLLIFYFNNTNSPPVAWDQPVWNVLLRMDVSSTAIFHVLECRTVSARLKSGKNLRTTKNWLILTTLHLGTLGPLCPFFCLSFFQHAFLSISLYWVLTECNQANVLLERQSDWLFHYLPSCLHASSDRVKHSSKPTSHKP